jgi:hypothetical protein
MPINYISVTEQELSKIEVAKIQINTAIRLYFRNEEMVSIRTLADSAYSVLVQINRFRGGKPLAQEFSEFVDKPEMQQMILRANKMAFNFFTGADEIVDKIFIFQPEATEPLIYNAIRAFRTMEGYFTGEMLAFEGWFIAWFEHPELISTSINLDLIRKAYSKKERERFYSEWKDTFETVAKLETKDYDRVMEEHTKNLEHVDSETHKYNDAIPLFKNSLQELVELTGNYLQLDLLEDDYYGNLLIGFYKRMLRHIGSLVTLHKSRDVLMIARSIIEGEGLIKWIGKESELNEQNRRARRYLDLFLIEATQYRGQSLSADQKEELQEILIKTFSSSDIVTTEECNDLAIEPSFGNIRFLERLTGYRTLHSLFEYLDAENEYTQYALMSSYLHWNPSQMKTNSKYDSIVDTPEITVYEMYNVWFLSWSAFTTVCNNIGQHFMVEDFQKILDHQMSLFEAVKLLNIIES